MQQIDSWELKMSSLNKKFPAFYDSRMFITVFREVSHLSLSWSRSIQSTPLFYFLNTHFNTSIPSKPWFSEFSLYLTFPHWNTIRTSPIPHKYHTPRPAHYFLFYYLNNIWRDVRITKFLIMQCLPLHSYLVPLMPKYLPPHHLICKHPQPVFLPLCEKQSSTSI